MRVERRRGVLVPLAELEASAEQHLAGTLPLFRENPFRNLERIGGSIQDL